MTDRPPTTTLCFVFLTSTVLLTTTNIPKSIVHSVLSSLLNGCVQKVKKRRPTNIELCGSVLALCHQAYFASNFVYTIFEMKHSIDLDINHAFALPKMLISRM